MERYGVEHIAQLEHERKKRSKLFSELDRSKYDYSGRLDAYRKTVLERYGGKNTGWLSNGRKTRIDNGHIASNSVSYNRYQRDVRWFTEKNDLTLLEHHELRDSHSNNPNAYHLDHMVSILECYNNGVHPEIAGSIYNLRFIHWRDNISKWSDSCMTVEELIRKYNERI